MTGISGVIKVELAAPWWRSAARSKGGKARERREEARASNEVADVLRYWRAIYTSQRSKEANLKQGKKKVVENTEGRQEFKED
ncbi:hypothetical protein BVRB_2g035530 isoform B [Beta vulgaris subsp. vulgaris]|nr:hypothetical protein BVRB_2g035530 isoform B [Beta vulgaris subsp. vulgaris]